MLERRSDRPREWIAKRMALAIGAAIALGPPSALAASDLALPFPTTFGSIPAATFDSDQHRVGGANLVIERLDGGNVRIMSESGVDGGARTIASAELTPIDDQTLKLVSQSSRSFDPSGNALGTLEIDHEDRQGTCTGPAAQGSVVETVALPERDRVANVPLNLLFDPLVRGASDSVDFQVLLCRGGARLMNFHASIVHHIASARSDLVEVRFGPDLGAIASFIAKAVTPKLSFWFDNSAPGRWLAHRMPLYSDGPEVFVVRQGVPTNLLVD